MSAQRKLAYAGSPGVAHDEQSWIKARQWLQGETKEQAAAAIQAEISAKRIIVIEAQT